jgi:hypothetical protein
MSSRRNRMMVCGLCFPELLGVAFFLGVASSVASAGTPSYRARFITPGIGAINAAAMNQAGDVVGTISSGPGTGAWVSHAGAAAVFLPLPPGVDFGYANCINDAGVVVGSVGFAYPGYGRAVAWIPDASGGYTIRELGMLAGHVHSDATAINNVGDIVGWSSNGTFRSPVLFSAPGGIQDLLPTGVFDPKDINDHRVLVDTTFKRLDLNTMSVESPGLPGPNYRSCTGEAINESGRVAGSVILATGTACDHEAAFFSDEGGWEVLSGCGPANSVWDLNDLGDVVMRLNLAPYVRFEGIGTFLIEDLIVADAGHWSVINGYGLTINNARQMAVPATNSATSQSGIILLTPFQGCSADFNGDGDVGTDADIEAFFACVAGSCCSACPPDGDFNGDGDVGTDADIEAFFRVLAGGSC